MKQSLIILALILFGCCIRQVTKPVVQRKHYSDTIRHFRQLNLEGVVWKRNWRLIDPNIHLNVAGEGNLPDSVQIEDTICHWYVPQKVDTTEPRIPFEGEVYL